MVTVSNFMNNKLHNSASASFNNNFSAANNSSYVDQNFQAGNNKKNKLDTRKYKEDTLLDNTLANRMKISVNKTLDIPLVHFPRGLGGAPDYTFYEFLQTAKFPYYIGGPILAALFYAGVKHDNLKSAAAAKNVAKHMALGVGLYYVGAAAAKAIVNTTVKFTRGVDLKHPYAKAVSTSTNQTGVFKKDVEFHTAFESADFTRTDLMYKKGKTPEEINAMYARYGKKYGLDENANDIDQSVKPLLKKTIIMARAWQYALTAFFVTLGIGMANQPAWDLTTQRGYKDLIKKGIFGREKLPMKERMHNLKVLTYDRILKPFGQSFKQFWQGNGSKGSSIAGKSVILAAGIATLTAISLLIGKTSGKKHELESSGTNKIKEVQS